MSDRFYREPGPKQDMAAAAKNLADVWVNLAEHSAAIANARRVMFLAYVSEGFTEAQALELVKAA